MKKPLIDKLSYLEKLQPETKQLWGKMSAQHMVEHLVFAVRTSNGKLNIGCFNPPGKWPTFKRFLLSSRPLPKEFLNPIIGADLLPLEYKNLDEAKTALALEVDDYYKYFEEKPDALLLNPTFGELNKAEWDVFHSKHFTHHFEQFGINL
ncbi:hypothetical protein C0389_08100 [bacterium]|nr:hypothetical protein [bacterium]